MKDQHNKIKGYRDLTQEEIDLMNEGKELAEKCDHFLSRLINEDANPTNSVEIDHRWLNIGRTHLQQGFMAVIRSVTRPTTF